MTTRTFARRANLSVSFFVVVVHHRRHSFRIFGRRRRHHRSDVDPPKKPATSFVVAFSAAFPDDSKVDDFESQ